MCKNRVTEDTFMGFSLRERYFEKKLDWSFKAITYNLMMRIGHKKMIFRGETVDRMRQIFEF